MPTAGERIYLLGRERQCREMALRAHDPAVKHIHIEMADAYARRARQPDLEDESHRVSA